MQIKVNVGDRIGMIIKFLDPKKYELREAEVKTIKITKNGAKVYAPKCFRPIDLEEIEFNTSWMKQNKNLILTREPVLMDDELRERMDGWCGWATEHYEELENDGLFMNDLEEME